MPPRNVTIRLYETTTGLRDGTMRRSEGIVSSTRCIGGSSGGDDGTRREVGCTRGEAKSTVQRAVEQEDTRFNRVLGFAATGQALQEDDHR